MSTVTGFTLGYTTSGFTYASARLSCGHVASVEMMPRRGRCCGCETEMDLLASGVTYCACGKSAFIIVNRLDPHVEADRKTKIGDEIACETCVREVAQLEWLKSIDPAEIQHARFKYGSYHFYRRDDSSPTGVILMGSVNPTPAVEALLAARRVSPLSPTERA